MPEPDLTQLPIPAVAPNYYSAELKEGEEYECDAELRDAQEAMDEAFEEVIGAVEDQRDALNKAERLINEAFGYGLDIEDRAAA